MTELRRTGQAIGIVFMINGEFVAVFLADPPVVEGPDGEGVTENIWKVVLRTQYSFTIDFMKQSLTSLAFDGAYFGLKVPEIFAARLHNPLAWLMPAWDGAHRLELVMSDIRKGEQVVWYKEASDFTAEILSKFAHGKNIEEVMKNAADLVGRTPLAWRQTHIVAPRFAQAEPKVYNNFMRNWRVQHKREVIANPNTKSDSRRQR
ncbi:hypothetical protein CYMTET_15641 [Cymbomonas tetramitiformis]|uniref:Uncharacterized protein n=1 Tax=Cymbomonas tetramitiformis TaxID=36881 RepID=A0AAE0L950_9CHLO|nr:hypothetical protein CYMTET_15641 [Cymbomonas tetramitiformis]